MGACAIASYIVGIIAALMLSDKSGIDMRALDRESGSSASHAVGSANLQPAGR
jgi:gas vesicle protein